MKKSLLFSQKREEENFTRYDHAQCSYPHIPIHTKFRIILNLNLNLNFNFNFNLNDARSMEPIMDNGVQTLSGGELQRCAIVLCLGTAADIYLVPSLPFRFSFPLFHSICFSILLLYSSFLFFLFSFIFNPAVFPLSHIFYPCNLLYIISIFTT